MAESHRSRVKGGVITVVGWHQQAIEPCGGKAVTVAETHRRTRGDPHCQYHCEWT